MVKIDRLLTRGEKAAFVGGLEPIWVLVPATALIIWDKLSERL